MNNLFLRLYVLIVSTILIVGIALDQTWQYIEKDEQQSNNAQAILNLVSYQLETLEGIQLDNYLLEVNQHNSLELSLIPINSQLIQSLAKELHNNQIVFVENNTEVLGLKKIISHNEVLQLRITLPAQDYYLEKLFIVLFYSLIALGVFYWIWPLSKDLNQLESAVKQFDQQHYNSKVDISARSSINHLAIAYNALLDKIKLLIETQQAMSHSISHELRTPLARIRFSLQMAKESKSLVEIKEQIDSVADDISEMNQLINELLNFASLENTSTIATMEKGNINLLIETLLEKLKANQANKSVVFNRKTENIQVLCDSYLIERAIQNLIVNAIKFANQKVTISTQLKHDSVEILVEDDGIGVEESDKDKVFDSFVQLEHQHKNKGFGLGLAIVRRVMQLHKGNVKVTKSSLGGAKFILRWPS